MALQRTMYNYVTAQLNYLVHEKELLSIIHTLQKWHTDLLSVPITIYTDHHTLENFDQQKDLPCSQAQWWGFFPNMYDHHIVYIPGDANCIADTLSKLPNTIDDVSTPIPVTVMLTIESDPVLLDTIQVGYLEDLFCA